MLEINLCHHFEHGSAGQGADCTWIRQGPQRRHAQVHSAGGSFRVRIPSLSLTDTHGCFPMNTRLAPVTYRDCTRLLISTGKCLIDKHHTMCRLFKGLTPLWGRQIPYTMMKFGELPAVSPRGIWADCYLNESCKARLYLVDYASCCHLLLKGTAKLQVTCCWLKQPGAHLMGRYFACSVL